MKESPERVTYRWRKRLPQQIESVFSGDDFPDPPSELPSPGRYFRLFFDHALFEKITEETNLYSTQVSGKSINTTAKEIEQFIGIFLMMGIVKYPQFRMYWAPHTKIPAISDIMGLKRFETIKQFFHINNNTNMPKRTADNFDKLYKVRPLLDMLQTKCRKHPQEECHAVDEQIIPTKSRSGIRQYLPNKPHKWGIKVWARCGVSGMLYDFEVYTGKAPPSSLDKEYGKVGAVVVRLMEHLPKSVGHKVYME